MCLLGRCGRGMPAGAIPTEEQGESHEVPESKTVQHEAGRGDQQTLQPAENTGEIQRTVKGKPQVETIKYNIKYRCDALSLKL